MNANLHASAVKLGKKGILIFGASGSGKSDLSLRLIVEHKAKLIADDRVNLKVCRGKIVAAAPTLLKNKLEVRGIGIINLKAANSAVIDMSVRLANNREEIDRLPAADSFEFGGVEVPQVTLYAKEASTPAKIVAALTLL